MSESKFKHILKKAMKEEKEAKKNLSLSDLDSHTILPIITLSKQRGDVINLPDSFKNNDAIGRYYKNICNVKKNNLDINT